MSSIAQTWSRRRFNYGTYIVTAMGDSQGMNHAWYLQNMQPASPNDQTTWRWTEFDWEFVPQCNAATPVNRIEGVGPTFPFTDINASHVFMESFQGVPGPLGETGGQQTDQSFAQSIVDNQWAWMAAHGPQGLDWPAIPPGLTDPWSFVIGNAYLRPDNLSTDGPTGWMDLDSFQESSIGWGYPLWPVAINSMPAVPTYAVGSSGQTQLEWPSSVDLTSAISVNVINVPVGTTPVITYDGSSYDVPEPNALFIPYLQNAQYMTGNAPPMPENLWQFFQYGPTAPPAAPAGYPGRQSFVYGNGYNPANQFYDYTIVWTPTSVAFYISPAGQGANYAAQEPVYILSADQNPTVTAFGPGAYGADQTFWFQDYDNPVALGDVFLSFQLWNMGPVSFSGPQTANSNMYIRAAQFIPSGATAPALAIDFTQFNSNDECLQQFTRDFAILSGSDYQANNVNWVASTPGSQGAALQLSSILNPGPTAAAQWYGLGPAGWTGTIDLAQQVVAKIDDATGLTGNQSITFAAASSGEAADWFQVTGSSETSPVTAVLFIKNPSSGAEAQASVVFTSDEGLSNPSYKIGTPSPLGKTTQEQANALFSGLNGTPQVISPQLYNGS